MKVFRKRTWTKWAAVLAVFALIAAACGDDDDSGATTTTAAEATETTAAAEEMPFEGVTLKFAKAPHGEDEIENFEQWFAPFTEATGIEIEHTVVPWNDLEAI